MFKKSSQYFLRQVAAPEDLPPDIAALVRRHLPDYEGIITIPPQDYPIPRLGWMRALPFAWRTTPARTLVFGPEYILIIESTSLWGPRTTLVPLADVLYSEITVNLLYACLRLVWASDEGRQAAIIEFDATGMEPLRQQFDRARARTSTGRLHPALPGQSGRLEDLPLKFYNYAHYALLPGEHVQAAFYQPSVRRMSDWPPPQLGPNRAFLLTDLHLMVSAELTHGPASKYGVVTRVIPRGQIRAVECENGQETRLLCLMLGSGISAMRLSYPLSREHAAALRAVLGEQEPLGAGG